MKRKIKFRGLRINFIDGIHSSRWVFGNLLDRTSIGYVGSKLETYSFAEVQEDSVGQYTGLFDKFGTDIYEGDLLANPNGNYGTIVFDEGKFCIETERKNGSIWFMPLSAGFVKNKHIRGNIHENSLPL